MRGLEAAKWGELRSLAQACQWGAALKIAGEHEEALTYLQDIARERGELDKLQALVDVRELEALEANKQLHPSWDRMRLRLATGGHYVQGYLSDSSDLMYATIYRGTGQGAGHNRDNARISERISFEISSDREQCLRAMQQFLLRVIRGDELEEEARLLAYPWPRHVPFIKLNPLTDDI